MRRQWRGADIDSSFDRAPVGLGKDMLLQLRDAVGTGVVQAPAVSKLLLIGLEPAARPASPQDVAVRACAA